MIYVRDARELDKAMKSLYEESDIVIMAAAVSDYRPIAAANQKIKKEENDDLMIHLSLNPDILFDLGQKRLTSSLLVLQQKRMMLLPMVETRWKGRI